MDGVARARPDGWTAWLEHARTESPSPRTASRSARATDCRNAPLIARRRSGCGTLPVPHSFSREMSNMFCPKCGQTLADDAKVCVSCGAPIPGAESSGPDASRGQAAGASPGAE
ncbi:MAG: zinc-ribbon domain-containing protein, partial [Casimicrobiaceae bacterium]